MSEIVVRPAAPEDAAGLARVKIDAWRATYAHFMGAATLEGLDHEKETARWQSRILANNEDEPVWMAFDRDEALGFLIAGPNRFPEVPCDAELHAIYVHPTAQRRGVGRALLREAASWLLGQGYEALVVFVFRDNHIGASFYRSLGAEFYNSGEFEVNGTKYPDASYVWHSLPDLCRSLA